MEQQTAPQSTQPDVQNQTSPPQPVQPTQKRWSIMLIVVILILFTGTTVYFVLSTKATTKNQPAAPVQTTTIPTVIPKETPIPSYPPEVSNWSTYVDQRYNFSIKYPPIWTVLGGNERNQNQTNFPYYMNQYYIVSFNLNHRDKSWLSVGISVYKNPEKLSLIKWITTLNYRQENDPIITKAKLLTIDGQKVLQTRISPSFENVYIDVVSPKPEDSKIYSLDFFGNGEGTGDYPDNDPIVQEEWKNFQLFVSTLRFNTSEKTISNQEQWKTYTSVLGKYSLQYPSDWYESENINQQINKSIPTATFSPSTNSSLTEYGQAIIVSIYDNPTNLSLEEFVKKNIGNADTVFFNTPVSIDGVAGKSAEIPGEYKNLYIFVKKDSQIYNVIWVQRSGKKITVNQFNTILTTLRFK